MRFRVFPLLSALILALVSLAGCASGRSLAPTTPYPPESYPATDLLVTPGWLQARLADPQLRVVDLSPIHAYDGGHIPGAVHLWWQDTIEVHNDVYGMMVGVDGLRTLVRQAGISASSDVVLYDSDGDRYAARFLWMLQANGFDHVHLLDGGRQAWSAAGLALSTAGPKVSPGGLDLKLDYSLLIAYDELQARLRDGSLVIVDNRTPAERGETWYGKVRVGRIPGAALVPWDETTQNGKVPYYDSVDALRARFLAAGVVPSKTVVVYGIDGVEAAQTYVALKLLGYPSVKVYDGSWAEWGARPDLPIEPLSGPNL